MKNFIIKPSINDEFIFSYIHIQNAINFVCPLYKEFFNFLISEDWASRKDLKLKIINSNHVGKGENYIKQV